MRKRRFARAVTILLLLAYLPVACGTWKNKGRPPEALDSKPAEIRVTLRDGRQTNITQPHIVGDSLVGTKRISGSREAERVAFLTTDVTKIEVNEISAARVGLLVAGVGVTVLVVMAAASGGGGGGGGGSSTRFSCPLVYSWDGSAWTLDSGTFGGAIARPLARTDVDVLDHLRPDDEGLLRLRINNELEETDYIDALALVAVDHDPDAVIAPGADGRIHALGPFTRPTTARDFEGRDALARVTERDGWSWESALIPREPGSNRTRDGLDLAFPRPPGSRGLLLLDAHNTPWASFLLGELVRAHGGGGANWAAALEADPARASAMGAQLAKEAFLSVSVWDGAAWRFQSLAWEAGPELVKRQVVPIDLSLVPGDVVRVRLEAPASFWLIDHVALAMPSDREVRTTILAPAVVGPGAADDLLATIAAEDGRELTMETGDSFVIGFRAPPIPKGRARTYLLRSTGWYQIRVADSPVDRALLESLEEPGAIATLAAARLNAALAVLAP